jgi:D-3-phosphoglycerate dehydrogenase
VFERRASMKILISDAFAPTLPDKLARFGEVTDDKSRLPEVDVVLVRSKTKCTKEYIDEAKNLKLIIRGGVGIDNIDVEYARSKGIEVRNTPEASSIAVAELTMALLVGIPNNLVPGHMGMAEGKWLKKQLKRTELYGKTLGLIGIGRIATEVAKRAKAFGMRIVAYDPYIETSEWAEVLPTLEEVLGQADFVSLHVPLTDETKGMINRTTIAHMKDGAILINTGRGKCVIEEDVAEALRSGKLRAYGTDVWYCDPPDESCALLNAPNVTMTPHIGASSKENLLRIGDVVERILDSFPGR